MIKTNINKFFEGFSTCLSHFSTYNQTIYLLGDLNIDLDKFNRSKIANNYINIKNNSAIPLITLLTRVTPTTSTIFHHVITIDLKHKIAPFVIRSDLTDQYITVCNIKNIIHYKRAKSLKYHRNTSKLNCEGFCNELDQNLSQCFLHCDVPNHLNYYFQRLCRRNTINN